MQIIRHFGIIPFGASIWLGATLMTGVGLSSNQYLSLQNPWSTPLSLYAGERPNGTEWDYEWDRIAASWFHGIGGTVWAEGNTSAALCWIGLTLCSPLLALQGFLGLVVGSCTLVLMNAPGSMIYNAYYRPSARATIAQPPTQSDEHSALSLSAARVNARSSDRARTCLSRARVPAQTGSS